MTTRTEQMLRNHAMSDKQKASAERSDSTVDRLVMWITTSDEMVNIDAGEQLAYGNIKGMYGQIPPGHNGHGLQLNEKLEHKRGEIIDLCAGISDKIYELKEILTAPS